MFASSDNGGMTWTERTSLSTNALLSIAFDARTGRAIAVGFEGTVLTSNNNGANWTERASGHAGTFSSVAFDASTGRAIVVGPDGVVFTSGDYGTTWTERASGTSALLSSVAFDASTGRAIVVGTFGTVLTSSDYGATWSSVVFRGSIYPAPISWLGILLFLGSLTLLLFQRDRRSTESFYEPSATDSVDSDQPAGPVELAAGGDRTRRRRLACFRSAAASR